MTLTERSKMANFLVQKGMWYDSRRDYHFFVKEVIPGIWVWVVREGNTEVERLEWLDFILEMVLGNWAPV